MRSRRRSRPRPPLVLALAGMRRRRRRRWRRRRAARRRGAAREPMKIVPLNGDLAEIVFALGLGDEVVGVDISATYPAEAAAKPKIGYQRTLSAEGIIGLQPTIALGTDEAGPPEVIDQIEKAGVTVEILPIAEDGRRHPEAHPGGRRQARRERQGQGTRRRRPRARSTAAKATDPARTSRRCGWRSCTSAGRRTVDARRGRHPRRRDDHRRRRDRRGHRRRRPGLQADHPGGAGHREARRDPVPRRRPAVHRRGRRRAEAPRRRADPGRRRPRGSSRSTTSTCSASGRAAATR